MIADIHLLFLKRKKKRNDNKKNFVFDFIWNFNNSSVTKQRRGGSIILFKGCVRYSFASLFCMSKREHFKTRENAFYFSMKALLVLEIIKFQHFRYSNIMTSSNAQA